MPAHVEVQVSSPNPPWEYLCVPEPVKPAGDRRATASVELYGSSTREDGLDRTRPSPGPAAVGFGGGTRVGQGAVTAPGDLGDGEQDQRLTATVVASGYQQRPATAHNARTIRANWGYVRPEKRTVGGPRTVMIRDMRGMLQTISTTSD